MKAAAYGNPGVPAVLEYVDMPDPACGPGAVLIADEAIPLREATSLVNCTES
jgi:NADPH:quinone reductase